MTRARLNDMPRHVIAGLIIGLLPLGACSSSDGNEEPNLTTASGAAGGQSTDASSNGAGAGSAGGGEVSGSGAGGDGTGGDRTGGNGGAGAGGEGAGGGPPGWVVDCATATYPVEVVGSGSYQTVVAAVTAAPAGATVRICPGTYVEPTILVERNLTLIGSGEGQTVLQSDGVAEVFIDVQHADLSLEDVTVEQAGRALSVFANDPHSLTIRRATFTQNSDSAIVVGGPSSSGEITSVVLEDVTLTDNQGVLGGGLHLHKRVEATLTGCTLENNGSVSKGGAMRLAGGAKATVVASTVRMNAAPEGGGAFLDYSQIDGAAVLETINSDWGAGQLHENMQDDVFCAADSYFGDLVVGWLGSSVSVECHPGISTCCQ